MNEQELYEALTGIRERLAGIETKLDNTQELEQRVRKLEQFRMWVVGAVAAAGGLGGGMGFLLTLLFGH